jgi:hypothetical protein
LNAVAEKDHQALAMRFKAALAEDPSGTTGGYLVPPELAEGLLAVAGPEAVLRRATPLVMTEEFLKVPALDPTLGAVVSGDTSLFGQARVQWNAEATQPANDCPPSLARLELRDNQALSQFDLSEAVTAGRGPAAPCGRPHARTSFTTFPFTSVSRMSRPAWRYVRRSWSSPSRCRMVACQSWTCVRPSTAS